MSVQSEAEEQTLIVGSGLIASAFLHYRQRLPNVCIYAAGVSNSGCTDAREFERERVRLLEAMSTAGAQRRLLYFSTCSVADPSAQSSAYVLHKSAMEQMVLGHPQALVLRIPQVAGITPNPHTLLNYLYARITRSERFEVWRGAHRNIIDVDDVARIATDLVVSENASGEVINIANTRNFSMFEIIQTMEAVLGRKAIFDVVDRGAEYLIDTRRAGPSMLRCDVTFPATYLRQVVEKYYRRK